MASRFKNITSTDIKVEKSRLNQLIDIISSDIYSLSNRKKYPSFVTGLTTPVTSSLFQTIYDQDYTYQSSNAMLDISFGVYANISGSTVTGSTLVTELSPTISDGNKLIFDTTTSTMMREKINVYKQYAQILLGDANSSFFTPFESTLEEDRINEAIFINVKRLFKRDNIYKGSFGIKFFDELTPLDAASCPDTQYGSSGWTKNLTGNLFSTSNNSTNSSNQPVMLIDTNGSTNYRIGYAGEVGSLKKTIDSGANYGDECGLIFYDAGIIVLDVKKIFSSTEQITGVIDFPDSVATNNIVFKTNGNTHSIPAGKKAIGYNSSRLSFYGFLKLATLDDIIDHFCMSRFSSGLTTAIAFQNETIINSTIYYCNAAPDDFNYSTNPTYSDEAGKIVVVEDENDIPFSYVTTVGLYNAASELVAVAKLSRPVEKNPLHNLSIRVRLDY